MPLILTRSPYSVSRLNLDEGATMTLEIGEKDTGVFIIFKSYSLSFRSKLFIDISPLIRDFYSATYSYDKSSGEYFTPKSITNLLFVRVTIDGLVDGVAPAGGSTITEWLATDGYLYNTDSFNEDKFIPLVENAYYTGSSNTIYKLDDSNIRITLLKSFDDASSEIAYIDFYNKGLLVKTIQTEFNPIQLRDNLRTVSDNDYSSYKERVDTDNGTLEGSNCLDVFFRNTELDEYDRIIIRTDYATKVLRVNTITECKYDPYRITFKNRFGTDEDLWFFKKSSKSLKVSKEDFRSNEFKAYNAGATARQMQQYNKNGRESLTLNSGFVVEEINESFKQLMLSEEVTLYDFKNDITSAINISNGELEYKTVTNDKLINYTIDIEFSNTVINSFV